MDTYFMHVFPQGRALQCITVGRANVDCYLPQGERLCNARQYDVFVGGSPANIAAGLSKLKIPTGIITRVADDAHGAFVTHYLSSVCNVDTSHIQLDTSGAKTSLAFAERRPDADTIMYRNNVTDLLLDATSIDKQYIASSAMVCISGTALTAEPSRSAIFTVLEYAKEAGTICAMDIDYRPYGWESLTHASETMTKAASYCDIIIGTREEFEVAGASSSGDDYSCATTFLHTNAKLVVVKRGDKGSLCVYKKDDDTIESIEGLVFSVQVVKPYGAGDAFASGLLGYLLKGKSIQKSLQAAAASASINISGFSCTEAMPTEQEIESMIKQNT